MSFDWTLHKEAEQFIITHLIRFCEQNKELAELNERLKEEAGARLFDYIDHLSLGSSDAEETLLNLDFVKDKRLDEATYVNMATCLPRIRLGQKTGLAIAVEDVAHFLTVHGLSRTIEGTPYSPLRRALISDTKEVNFWVIERRKADVMEPVTEEPQVSMTYLTALEKWRTRDRHLSTDEETMSHAIQVAKEQVESVGQTLAAQTFFVCEMDYWRSRNRAGQELKSMLDQVGVGLAAPDHHAFRSSRRLFPQLITFFKTLGFHLREKFYAGGEAGWGAQVVENSDIGMALFLDLDLSAEELDLDFEKEQLEERNELGTVGLWCALHSDSLLAAGTHHMATQSSFDDLTRVMKKRRVKTMDPFSEFPYLRQAFTRGQRWKVCPDRVERLLSKGLVSKEDGEKFRDKGAIGSHLENIQRTEGFKGFNQHQVSVIMRETDPRKHTEEEA